MFCGDILRVNIMEILRINTALLLVLWVVMIDRRRGVSVAIFLLTSKHFYYERLRNRHAGMDIAGGL